ncbi:uncharacterized protein M6B38_358365 [Iris pallida]|uniref:Uncharacterized protein n=1 Tax=Iris pallida TaxID=29817 RepID=A0AAX6E4N1_IRIPA|nr:Uncharacterized protein M6B38_208555 [Iris pallida]KAJ6798987.1 Uncharacterized protein M6B38_208560 [Iris pallida]KAJ6829386.1 uncharacterized protein M6B38_358365 [Iris pallida]
MEHRTAHHRHTPSTASNASVATFTTTTRSSSTNSVCSTSPVIVPHRHRRLQPREPTPVNFAECAGGTAAECAAVCCCCPCGIAALLMCALVKLPAGLCRRALLRGRRRRIAAATAKKRSPAMLACGGVCDVEERFGIRKEKDGERWVIPAAAALAMSPEFVAIEKEMWARFYGTGFWRSPSQREDLR